MDIGSCFVDREGWCGLSGFRRRGLRMVGPFRWLVGEGRGEGEGEIVERSNIVVCSIRPVCW